MKNYFKLIQTQEEKGLIYTQRIIHYLESDNVFWTYTENHNSQQTILRQQTYGNDNSTIFKQYQLNFLLPLNTANPTNTIQQFKQYLLLK